MYSNFIDLLLILLNEWKYKLSSLYFNVIANVIIEKLIIFVKINVELRRRPRLCVIFILWAPVFFIKSLFKYVRNVSFLLEFCDPNSFDKYYNIDYSMMWNACVFIFRIFAHYFIALFLLNWYLRKNNVVFKLWKFYYLNFFYLINIIYSSVTNY